MTDRMKTILSNSCPQNADNNHKTIVFTKNNKDESISFFGSHSQHTSWLNEAKENVPTEKNKPYWLQKDQQWFFVIHIGDNAETAAETFFSAIKYQALTNFSLCLFDVDPTWIRDFHLRVLIQNYSFTKYMREDHAELKKVFLLEKINIHTNTEFDPSVNTHLSSSILWARDLANEPSNVCTPAWLASNVEAALQPLGVEIEVLEEDELRKIGMNALLGVAKGSRLPPKVVIMKYLHGERDSQPTVLLGKGVTFDAGGISLKPASNMGDMKDDMAGSAVVSASIRAIAATKAKVNVIGLIGLVENMPDGNAQKPGDVVKTLSGQTVEITNTDAEGRLVLCDLMWYAQDRFKPRCMVDYATLTGAIIIALGKEYGGLFSNNDLLSDELLASGIATGDKLWRMPLCEAFDRSIDSKVADIDNSGPREASSCTAGHFIGRFCNAVPWVHLDIAGTAFARAPSAKSPVTGGTGFGVHMTYHWLTQPLKLKSYL